jgi:hypothetical protein
VDHLIGVDLGQFSAYSAACVLRRTPLHSPAGQPERTSTGATLCRFDVLALKRYAHGTAYTDVVAHVVDQAQRRELWSGQPPRPPRICVDATGVGAPVMEMFRTALRPHPLVECWGVTITAGRSITQPGPMAICAAKQEIAGCIRSVLESSRLRVPVELEFASALKRELGDFTIKVTQAGNEIFEAGAGRYDDLVMCVAIPIFVATWLDSRQVPVIAGPGPRVLSAYRPASHAVTMGGVIQFRRPATGRDRSGWRPGSVASPFR